MQASGYGQGTVNTFTRTVVGVFDEADSVQHALKGLTDAGFAPESISVVARGQQMTEVREKTGDSNIGHSAATGAVGGGVVGGIIGVLAGAGLIVIPGIGPFLAAGVIGATLAGAAAGAAAGGLLGALAGLGVPEQDAHDYETQVNEGRILVTATASNGTMLQAALDAFNDAQALNTRYYETNADPSNVARQEGTEQAIAAERNQTTDDALNDPAYDQSAQEPLGQTGMAQSVNSATFLPPLATHIDPSKRDVAQRNTYAPDNAGRGQVPANTGEVEVPGGKAVETAPGSATPLIDEYHGPRDTGTELGSFGAGSDRVQ